MKTGLTWLLVAYWAMVCAACSSSRESAAREGARQSLPLANVDPSTAGAITGSVNFKGDPPNLPQIDMSANPACERQHPTPFRAETAIVNGNKTLRYAFVWLKKGLPNVHWAPPGAPAKLDQSGCVYRPHVLGLMVNQELAIENSDSVNHNVHAECVVNQPWNESQPPRSGQKVKRFAYEEILFPVTCSVHPWMRSYIAVVGHPYFAVTGEDGSFALKDVPPGTYTVEAVHERFGRREVQVTLAPKEKKTVEFTYGS